MYQETATTSRRFDRPRKLSLLIVFCACLAAGLFLMQFSAFAYTQDHGGSTPPNPALGFKVIGGSVAASMVLCILLLLYREVRYRWGLRWFEKTKKKSAERYFCSACGFGWDVKPVSSSAAPS